MERVVETCRLDVVLYWQDRNAIVIFKVACTWEPNVLAREQEKWPTWRTNLKSQFPQSAVLVVPVVVGTLGAVGRLRKRLRHNKSLETINRHRNQYEAMAGAIRIFRNHQGSRGDAVIG